MTRLNVTPTRMNLNTLKKRLATSKRGYKLLKDKQDELMRQFLEKIRENKRLREEVEADLKESSKGFLMASSFMSPEFLEEAVSFPTQKIGVDIKVKNVMSVRIPQMEFKIDKGGNENASMYPYGLAQTSADLDLAIKGLNKVLEETIKYIRAKLEENERATISRLMKVKDIISEA